MAYPTSVVADHGFANIIVSNNSRSWSELSELVSLWEILLEPLSQENCPLTNKFVI